MHDLKKRIYQYIDEHSEELVHFLRELVRINSADICHGIDGREKDAQRFLKDFLEKLGASTQLIEPDYATMADSPECPPGHSYRGRPNLIADFKGLGGGRSIVLSGHVDTMDPGDLSRWKHAPWSADIEDGYLYGVGSADMKGGMVAICYALKAVRAFADLYGDCQVVSVVDEEGGGNGTLDYVRRGLCKADGAIITEPTNCEIATSSRGVLLLRVEVEGQTGHPLYKWELNNAIEKALIIKDALYELERRWLATKCDPVFPHPCITLCMIEGGISGTSIPDKCIMSFQLDLIPVDHYFNGPDRVVDGMEVRKEVEEVIRRACASDFWLMEHPPALSWYQHVEPHKIDDDFELVRLLQRNCGAPIRPMMAGNDARHIVKAGVPCFVFGPGSMKDVHQPNEKVSLGQVIMATKALAATLVDWCGASEHASCNK